MGNVAKDIVGRKRAENDKNSGRGKPTYRVKTAERMMWLIEMGLSEPQIDGNSLYHPSTDQNRPFFGMSNVSLRPRGHPAL